VLSGCASKDALASKMGIKKFTGIFISPMQDRSSEAFSKVVAIFIDGNQFLYSVINMLKKASIKKEDNPLSKEDATYISDFSNTSEKDSSVAFWKKIEEMCKVVIQKELIEQISKFSKLRHITFCLDGRPVVGKMIQQFIRRKTSSYFIDKKGTLLLTGSMILPGTKLVHLFGSIVVDMFKASFTHRDMLFSLDNISGEGEHKMLDFYRHSIYCHQKNHCLVWADDSDVPVCMLSTRTENLYIWTKVSRPPLQRGAPNEASAETGLIREERIYYANDLRVSMCSDHIDRLNCQFFINFFGNDFLPEMLNTTNLLDSYNAFKEATRISIPSNMDSGKKIILTTSEGFFNPVAFLAFLNIFNDYEFYFRTSMMKNGRQEPHQFSSVYATKPPDDRETKLNFKRFYYSNVLRYEVYPQDLDKYVRSFTDTELHHFELKMAFSYLRTYIWYYYYANGYWLPMSDGKSFEPFYQYNFPPLFNSLKKVFMNSSLALSDIDNVKCLDDLLKIRPQRRTPEYYSRIPRYIEATDNARGRDVSLPHLFSVLQKTDAMLLDNATEILKVRAQYEDLYPVIPRKSMLIKTRLTENIDLAPSDSLKHILDVRGTSSDIPETAPGIRRRTFIIENVGTKVYPKFDLSIVMKNVAEALGMTLTSEPILPLIIGTVEHVDLHDFKDSNFAVSGSVDL
jgi:hypothetical protein